MTIQQDAANQNETNVKAKSFKRKLDIVKIQSNLFTRMKSIPRGHFLEIFPNDA